MAEILYDVKTICAAYHAQPDYVISRVEQVRTMVWGEHKVPLRLFRVRIERYIFSFLIELQVRGGYEALDQRGLAVKLVRKLLRLNHGFSVNPSGLRKSLVQRQGRRAGLRSRLIRQLQELPLGCGIKRLERNVGSGCCDGS